MPARQKSPGFALVEVLAATTVALLALAAVLRFHVELLRADTLAAEQNSAIRLAEDRIESLLAPSRAGFSAPANGSDVIEDIYLRAWTAATANPVVDLDVQVSWPNGDAAIYDQSLSTSSALAAALESGYIAVARAAIAPP